MPRNAIATQDVDFILPPEKMGELILKYIHHQVLDSYPRSESDEPIPVGGLQKLYFLLRSKTGHDFSLYKQSTLLRRIERRMKISLVKNLDEYIDRLQEHPEEIEALFQEMLINVTHFFRDPEAFQALAEKAIRPLILQRMQPALRIRVWVAGCSTGEEAYSLAIVIQEQIQALKADCKMQIYATDLDAQAIAIARRGFYSDGSLENVSAERLQAFFQQEDEGYQIKKNHPRSGGVFHPELDLRSGFLENRSAELPERLDLSGANAAKSAFSPVSLRFEPGWDPVSGEFGEPWREQRPVRGGGPEI